MTVCSICHSEIKDKVNMSCGSQHEYCFSCILKGIEVIGELRSCSLCNGGDKFIIIDFNSHKEETDEYFSIYLFKKSLPIIKKIIKDKSQNTCIVSEKILQFYVHNKTQLEFFHILNKDYEQDEIIKQIKWDHVSSMNQTEISDLLMGMAGDYILGSTNTQRTTNNGGGRGNLVYSFTAPNPFSGFFS